MNIHQRGAVRPPSALAPASPQQDAAAQQDAVALAVLSSFEAIRLSEMDQAALLDRTDTKYLLSEAQLFRVLSHLGEHYRILEIDGRRLHRYRTLYFDTPDMALYRQHHNGRRDRYKVRQRAYVDSDQIFLEIKHKVDADTTLKSRMQAPALSTQITPEARAFLQTHYPYPPETLEARLLNTFQRITLVSRQRVERLTIDVGLSLLWDDVHVSLAGIAIAEVKQNGLSAESEFIRQMRALGVRATGFSKYCIGVAMLYPEIKHNNFKPQLGRIARLEERRITCQPNNSC